MKKIFTLIITLLVLVGCSSGAIAKVSDGDTELITVADSTITKGNIFNMMRHQDLGTMIVDIAKTAVVNELVEVDQAIEDRAQELLDENKEYFGEAFENIILNSFESEQEFVELQLIPAAQQETLARWYFDDNFESIAQQQNPRRAIIITTDTVEDAQAVIEGLNADEDIEALVEEYGNPAANANAVTIASTSNVPQKVHDFVKSSVKGDMTNEPIEDATSDDVYVIKIVEDDVNEFIEEYFSIYVINANNMDTVFAHYFEELNFSVYDQLFYDSIKNNTELELFVPNN